MAENEDGGRVHSLRRHALGPASRAVVLFVQETLVPYPGSDVTLGREEKELEFITYTHSVPDTVPGILDLPCVILT